MDQRDGHDVGASDIARNSLACGTCRQPGHVSEDHRLPRVGAATFVVKGTEILLGRSNKQGGKLVIPGGGVRPYESVNNAARREILEEAGIQVLVQDILFVTEILNQPQQEHRIVIFMLGQYLSGELVPGDDLSEVFWVDTRKLDEYQDEMTDVTIDAIYKFSIAIRSRNMSRHAN